MPSATATKRSKAADHLGEIVDGVSYPQPVFQRLNGFGKHAMGQLRRQGLRTTRCGNRVFILGRDWLDFLATRHANTNQ